MNLDLTRRLYDLGWKAARPFLARHHRLQHGLAERELFCGLPRADLWIQAASVGEAFLAEELLRSLEELKQRLPRPLRVLLTTGTSQGMEILQRATRELTQGDRGLSLRAEAAYLPFDAPSLMDQALEQVQPRLVVLLETELWPGLLDACHRRRVPVGMVNARMSPGSLARYLMAEQLMRDLAPDFVLAISREDAQRFSLLFGPERVTTMPNIKWDRVVTDEPLPYTRNPLAAILRPKTPFAVLGSVREAEEPQVAQIITTVLAARPGTVIGLFPRHAHRVQPWLEQLAGLEVPTVLRSRQEGCGCVAAGSVIVWDTFGELRHAYALARAAFVGGSLAPLGGQNFLEAAGAGLIPCVGPHTENFAWVGEGFFEKGLATRVRDAEEAATCLLAQLKRAGSRDKERKAFVDYADQCRGGARAAAARLAQYL